MIGLKAMLLLLLCQVIQQATAECMVFECPANCYWGVDYNGCRTCNCDNTCRVTHCPGGYKCIMSPVDCGEKYPCIPLPECVVNEYGCYSMGVMDYPPGCYPAVDSLGCEIRYCGDTCQNVECPEGQKCVAFKHCFRPSCEPEPGCVPNDYATTDYPITATECPKITCPAECYLGPDKNGCTMCNCNNTCRTTECPEGYNCVMAYIDCTRETCYQKPQCVPDYVAATAEDPTATTGTTENPTTTAVSEVTCGPVCEQVCEYGHVKDENGCDTCPCNSGPTTSYDGA